MFAGPFDASIIKRAKEKNLISIDLINIRDFATDAYKSVDGHPFGGGTGMILRVDVVDRALQKIKGPKSKVILLDAGGTTYTQKKAREFSKVDDLILICGHYEGIDSRIRELVDEEISVGDYVLTGGEIPTMVVVDSIVRLVPGVLVKEDATVHESHTKKLLEYPQYTQPRSYKGKDVPEVLLSGNHAAIAAWRESQSIDRTKKMRPDLLKK